MVKTMAIVTIFSTVERLLGFVYRILLSRSLGSEGLGIYQISLSVIGLLMTITASGIPITVSRLMIKHESEKRKDLINPTVISGIFLSLIVSLPIVLVLYFFPKQFSFIFADERCYSVMKIILPGVVITSVYSVIRGFFWGKKLFFTYSIIELLEECIMLVFGIFFVNFASSSFKGYEGASYAVLISYVFSFLVSIIMFFIKGGRFSKTNGQLKPLISSATPITILRTSTSLINTLIAVILPQILVFYGTPLKSALSSYGELSGMSIPLIYIPSTLIGSIALVLVPELSNNYYNNRNLTLKNNIENAIKCSVFISCMIIPVFFSMGEQVGIMVYKNKQAGIYISNACLIMLPMSITMITTSILNSLNLEKKTLKYYLFGATFLIFSMLFLSKFFGIYSLILGLMLSYLTTAVLNLKLISRTTKIKPHYKRFLLASSLFLIPTTILGSMLYNVLSNYLNLNISVIFSSIILVVFNYTFYRVFDLFSIRKMFKNPS